MVVLLFNEIVKKQVDVKKRLDGIIVFEIEGDHSGSKAAAYVLSCPISNFESPKPLVDRACL